MREKEIEERLRKVVKKSGGIALKFMSPGFSGVPDRLVLMPGGQAIFVELKAPGKKARPLQMARHEMLRGLGFPVYVIDSMEGIEVFCNEICTA